jgi:hypothetical protein
MTAHVAYPRWDPSGAAATRSAPILAHLREQLRFDGLIVTDALTMAAARASLAPEEALVAPIRAGCDLLLYPPDAGAAVTALANALERDPTLEALATAATDRYRQALARTASTPAPEDVPIPDPRGREYALRLLDRGMVRGVAPDLRGGVEIVVVDDDAGGAHPPGPSDLVRRRLALEGAAEAFGGHRVVLAFAEPRMSKGRAGFGPESLALLQRSARDAALVVVFGHPRLGEQVPGSAPVLLAWHRQPLMQEAVADWLLARMR